MKHLSTIAIIGCLLLMLGLGLGYFWLHNPWQQLAAARRLGDEEAFEQIVAFWKNRFPNSTFEGFGFRRTNGPDGKWLHIPVPMEIEQHYTRKYSLEFLRNEQDSPDVLRCGVAGDLLLLNTRPLLSTNGVRSRSLGPTENEEMVRCKDYVVDNGRRDR